MTGSWLTSSVLRCTLVRRLTLLVSVLVGARSGAAAQVAERPFLDSLVVALESPPPVGSAPDLTRCRNRGALRPLCEGLMLLRHAVPAPDSMSFVHPQTGRVYLRGIPRHPLMVELQVGYRSHTLEGQRRLRGVRDAYPGIVGYALARLELAKGAPADSVAALLEQARAGGGLAPGVLDLLAARLAFREGDTVTAWRVWDRMLADTASVTGAVAWALLGEWFPQELVQRWAGRTSTAALSELTASPLHRSLVPVYLGQPSQWIPLEAYGRGYVLFRQGAPMLVGVFALPRQQLTWEDPGPDDNATVRVFYPMGLEITMVRETGGVSTAGEIAYRIPSRLPASNWEYAGVLSDSIVRQQSVGDPTRRLMQAVRTGTCGPRINPLEICPPTMMRPDSQAVGLVVEQGLALGASVVTVALREAGGGRTLHTFVPRAIPEAVAGLFASDLVLGMPGRGYAWRSRDRWVPMHPTGMYPKGAELSLFAQVQGLAPERPCQVTVAILAGEVERPGETAAVTLRMTETVAAGEAGEAEWYRQVRLGDLQAGGYRVRVTFQQGEQVVVREDWMRIVR